jgi:sulfur carrier protein
MHLSREKTTMPGTAATDQLKIIVNGEAYATAARSLAELVAGYMSAPALGGTKVATAVNGHFVPEALRATTALGPGDRVEIVSPRQGG